MPSPGMILPGCWGRHPRTSGFHFWLSQVTWTSHFISVFIEDLGRLSRLL